MASSKNIGDQIADAVQSAVNSQNFSGLQSAIEKSIGAAATGISNGLAAASESIQRRQDAYARAQQQRRIEEAMALVYESPTTQRNTGIALCGWGGVIGAPCLIGALISISSGTLAPAIICVAGVAGGATLLSRGLKRLKLVDKFERYRDFIGLRDFCYIDELAASTADSSDNVLRNVKEMLSRGLFKQAALGDGEKFLALTTGAYQQYQTARLEAKKNQEQQRLVHGDGADLAPQAKALLERGEAYIKEIRESNQAIPDEAISRTLDQIEHVVRTIFERAAEHPEVIDDLGHLMDYYLPTTVKLLDAYRDLDSQPIESETIANSKREIEGALNSLSVAFEKLLDSVFHDMAVDVSTDISVLHTVLAQEGLVEDPFSKQSQHVQP